MRELPEYKLDRTFAARGEMVWRAFTTPNSCTVGTVPT